MREFTIILKDKNTIKTPGIDWGYGVGSELQIIYQKGKYLLLKRPACQNWVSRGEIETSPALYMIGILKDGTYAIGGEPRKYFERLEKREPGYS